MTASLAGPILLPSKPGLQTDTPAMLDWGGPLTPALGGPVQTILRLGTRHALDFTLPPMRTEPDGRIWAAKLRLARLYGALAPFGQDGLAIGAPGDAVAVDGAGQSGSALALRGLTPNYVMRLGQALSHRSGARWYLYFAADAGRAGADGRLTIPIFPMLRRLPADGDPIAIGRPMIQGTLSKGQGNRLDWDRQTAPWTNFGGITITEDE